MFCLVFCGAFAPFLFFPCTWFYFVRTYIRTGNKGEKVLLHGENFKKWQKSCLV